jgi:Kdo2-lipid IVA lauroyltransferase/acyltransferase
VKAPPLRTRVRRRLRALLLHALVFALGLLPLGLARRLGRGLGRLAHALAAKQRTLAHEHLRLAFPDRDEDFVRATALECFAGLGENVLELCVARRRPSLAEGLVRMEPEDMAALDEALAEGKGCLVVSGHIGSWELAARALAGRGYEVVAVARRFHDPGLGALIEGFRARGGVVTLPRGAPGTVRRLLSQIRKGGAIFVLVDQDTRVPSVFVPFFGRTAKTPRGPAELALRTGGAVVAAFVHREGEGAGHRMRTERIAPPPPSGDRAADALELTALMTRRLEHEIREHPADWVWFHERWRSRPEDEEHLPDEEQTADLAEASSK